MLPKVVWLSNLNFAGFQPASSSSSSPTPGPSHGQRASHLASATPNRSGAHVRMSEDTLGEELAPDATIWKLYVEEATEQDQELANLQNKNLDLMLLFAALFSAILTAFLVEAKKMLEDDPAAKSAMLLLLIAQSQQRLELGTPETSLKVVGNAPFIPTTTARYVNGLWFTALALSLAAALVAMLAKEWLAGFVSSTVRPPYDYALQRQAKYNGLVSWRALYIIALLPSLLHLSLLLFALGLVVYLWSLDEVIALLIGAVAGATLFLYVVTAVLGAIFESCPFVTYISTYIRGAYLTVLGDRGLFKNCLDSPKLFHHNGVSGEALQALGWLAANSRDPAVANCAYQALAAHTGLSQSPICSATESQSTGPGDKITSTNQTNFRRIFSNSEMSTNSRFLHAICKQFMETIMHRHREVAACFGTNLARYAVALPTLATHIEAFRELELPGGKRHSDHDWRAGQNCFELAFSTLDSIWSNDCVPLSADTYAILTSAELQLTASLTSLDALDPYHADTSLNPPQPSETHHQLITFTPLAYGGLKTGVSPARYCRTLARASVLLHYHQTSQALISTTALVHLLRSISSVVNCQRVIFSSDLEVKVNVVGGATEHCPNVNMLGDPNGIFWRLLKIWDMEAMPGTWSRLEDAASQAVSSFAHHFLGEWMGRNEIQGPQTRSRSSSYRGIDFELPITAQEALDKEAFDRALESWPDQSLPMARRPSPAVLSRLLVISAISICQAERLNVPSGFPTLVLRALYRSAEILSGQRELYAVIATNGSLVKRLVQLIENNADILGSSDPHLSSFVYLTRFLALPFERRTLMSYCGLHPQEIVMLLKTIERTSNIPVEVELLLDDVVRLLQDRPGTYVPLFAEENTAILTLLDIGQHDENIAAVTNTLQHILQYLADLSLKEQPIKCNLPGAYGLLAGMNFVLANMSSGKETTHPETFTTRIVEFLQCNVEQASWNELAKDLHTANSEGGRPDQKVLDAIGRFSNERYWGAAGLPRMTDLERRLSIGDIQ